MIYYIYVSVCLSCQKCVGRKKKASSIDLDEAPIHRIRRSQVKEFDFKNNVYFVL